MNKIDNSVIEIDLDNCTKCKACVNDCVAHLFYIKEDTLHIIDDFTEYCILCGHCVAICPVNVITLKTYEEEETNELTNIGDSPDLKSLHNLILKRRSIRQFKKESVPKELIEKLLETARYSPTGSNSENVYYTIIQNKEIVTNISNYVTEKVKRFVKMMDDQDGRENLKSRMSDDEFNLGVENLPKTKAILKNIDGGIDFWCWNGDLIFIHGDKTLGDIITNSSLAAAHIMLAAETLGIGACSLGYLTFYTNQSKTIKKLINLPINHEVGYSLTIGYPNVRYKRIPPRKPVRVQWL